MEASSETNLEQPAVFRQNPRRNLQLVGERSAPTDQRKAQLDAREADIKAASALLNAAFKILGSRALVMMTALAAIGLFGWATVEPTGWRIAAACLFSVVVFLPALWADARGKS